MRERQAAEHAEARQVLPPGGVTPALGSAADALLAMQRKVGNSAVVQRLLGAEVDGGHAESLTGGHTSRCGGAVLAAALVGEAGAEPDADPLSAGGVATRQLTWADFADADETLDLDAQTGYSFSSSGSTFTATFSPERSWAKPSAKTGPGQAALLRHEQYHLDLAILMAQKATTAGQGGQAAMNRLVSRCAAQTRLYDSETAHGTDAAQQAAWEARIDAGTVPYGP